MDRDALKVAREVARELAAEGATAVVAVGSRLRGDAYEESDLDIVALGRRPQECLERHEPYLVSISWRTVRQERAAFWDPERIGGIIPAWRNARILHDPKGVARSLKREAKAWRWERVAKRSDAWVAYEIMGWAEEVHRLVGNLERRRRSAAAVQRSVLALRMASVLAVHHRILYDSENRIWDLVAAKMGTRWRRAQSAALGLGGEPFARTCEAALELYALAAKEVESLLNRRQRAVVAHACALAARHLHRAAGFRRGSQQSPVAESGDRGGPARSNLYQGTPVACTGSTWGD